MDYDRIRNIPVAERRTEDVQLIGILSNQGERVRAAYYDTRADEVFHAVEEEQSQEMQPVVETQRSLGPAETIADAVGDIGEEFGWEWVSEFGEENS